MTKEIIIKSNGVKNKVNRMTKFKGCNIIVDGVICSNNDIVEVDKVTTLHKLALLYQ